MDEYISREKAIETIQYRVCQGHGNKEHICERGSCAYCGIMEVMSDISSIEAADAQPVKHGKWIDIHEWCKMHNSKPSGIGFYYWCSNCGKCVNHRSNYCGECGAKMDGDAE